MPLGMWLRQLCIGEPNIRKVKFLLDRCAAIERPYGPAPMMTVSTFITLFSSCLEVYLTIYGFPDARAGARFVQCRCTNPGNKSLIHRGRGHLFFLQLKQFD